MAAAARRKFNAERCFMTTLVGGKHSGRPRVRACARTNTTHLQLRLLGGGLHPSHHSRDRAVGQRWLQVQHGRQHGCGELRPNAARRRVFLLVGGPAAAAAAIAAASTYAERALAPATMSLSGLVERWAAKANQQGLQGVLGQDLASQKGRVKRERERETVIVSLLNLRETEPLLLRI